MRGGQGSGSIAHSIGQALVVLIVVAVVARVVWWLLAPLLPALGVLLLLGVIGVFLLGGPRSHRGLR